MCQELIWNWFNLAANIQIQSQRDGTVGRAFASDVIEIQVLVLELHIVLWEVIAEQSQL